MAAPGAWLSGLVCAVTSGDALVVAIKQAGQPVIERQLTLAGLSAPRTGRRDDPQRRDEPYAWESREFMRQRCIGQVVTFRVEYSFSSRDFGSVFVGSGKENLAVAVVSNGLGRVRVPPGCALSNIADFQAAEAAARAASRGIWSKGEPPMHQVNDMTRDAQRARSFAPFLLRAGRTRAQVEFVISAGRLKLLVAKENATVLFSLSGVRCPRAGEPGGDAALAFMRCNLTHRDVDVEFESVDARSGAFMGALHVPTPAGGPSSRVPLALKLVEAGLAHVVSSADARPEGRQLRAAEEVARAAQKGLWKDYVEPASEADEAGADDAERPSVDVTVTDVQGGGLVYLQLRDDAADLAHIQEALAGVTPPEGGFAPSVGSLCCGRFTGDDAWYRAYVVAARGDQRDLFFCDFGNSERVPTSRLAPLDPALQSIPPLAHLASLAHVRVPALSEDCGLEAAQLVSSLTGGELTARVEARAKPHGGKRHAPSATPAMTVTLRGPEEEGEDSLSVNEALLRAGLARLPRGATPLERAAIDALRPHLDAARAARRGLFEYGDPDSDDEFGGQGAGRGRSFR